MKAKSNAQVQIAASGGVVICFVALTSWWLLRLPLPAFFAKPASSAPEPAIAAFISAGAPAPARELIADVVRILPNGDVVVAGRTEPGARVVLLDRGVPVAEVTADAKTGEFIFLPPQLAAGAHKLSLRAGAAGGTPAAESAAWSFVIALPTLTAHGPVPVVATDAAKANIAWVARGDTLWGLSRARLGRGGLYPTIYQANATKIHDPNRIYPGQELTIP
jgi:nucleoid-associated protein YgaU